MKLTKWRRGSGRSLRDLVLFYVHDFIRYAYNPIQLSHISFHAMIQSKKMFSVKQKNRSRGSRCSFIDDQLLSDQNSISSSFCAQIIPFMHVNPGLSSWLSRLSNPTLCILSFSSLQTFTREPISFVLDGQKESRIRHQCLNDLLYPARSGLFVCWCSITRKALAELLFYPLSLSFLSLKHLLQSSSRANELKQGESLVLSSIPFISHQHFLDLMNRLRKRDIVSCFGLSVNLSKCFEEKLLCMNLTLIVVSSLIIYNSTLHIEN
eukprot:TRINITY_DN7386_c0_g1_i3.p1 TRINITY_DN7386_c0_g1~~TRINITY_DN7386_c0_g1_i3.p1  ORF type:complete len:265 (+),score=-21.31 TRINITY_DN7386_c0_g1_i3:273-1067(+)